MNTSQTDMPAPPTPPEATLSAEVSETLDQVLLNEALAKQVIAQARSNTDRLLNLLVAANERERFLNAAIAKGGFRASPDVYDAPTLWCLGCGRDSGYHLSACSKASR